MPHLENWSLRGTLYEFTLETGAGSRLVGNVTDHPTLPDQFIQTSCVDILDTELMMALTASGNHYTLGKINPEYESWIKQYAISH